MTDLILALFAGMLTIVAPCTLPVLPILLGASIGQRAGARPALIAAGFVVSFAFVALALSAVATALHFDPDALRKGTTAAQTNLGGFILGTTLGLIWTPCSGPVLGAILTAIATSPDHAHGALLLLTYAVGAALPMLGLAYGGQAISTRLRSLAPYAGRLQQAFGAVVIAFALSAFLQYDAVALAWLGQFIPESHFGL